MSAWGQPRPVPVPTGIRGFAVALVALAAVLTPVAAGLLLTNVPVHEALGLTRSTDATVRSATHHPDRDCRWEYDLTWDGGSAELDACPGSELLGLDEGDRLEVRTSTVPVVDAAALEDDVSVGSLLGSLVLIGAAGGLAWVSAATAFRLRRLAKGRARGVPLPGTITRLGVGARHGRRVAPVQHRITVDLDAGPAGTGKTYVWTSLPTSTWLHETHLDHGRHVVVWSTRTGLLTRRLAGPWVLETTRECHLFFPARLRRRGRWRDRWRAAGDLLPRRSEER